LIKPARSAGSLPCRIDYLFVDFSQRIDFRNSLRLSEEAIQQAEVGASDADDGHGRIFTSSAHGCSVNVLPLVAIAELATRRISVVPNGTNSCLNPILEGIRERQESHLSETAMDLCDSWSKGSSAGFQQAGFLRVSLARAFIQAAEDPATSFKA
jgi:hypothetical protein